MDALADDRLRTPQVPRDLGVGLFVEDPCANRTLLPLGQLGQERLHPRLAAQRGELLDPHEILVVEGQAPVAELAARTSLDPSAPEARVQLVLRDPEQPGRCRSARGVEVAECHDDGGEGLSGQVEGCLAGSHPAQVEARDDGKPAPVEVLERG